MYTLLEAARLVGSSKRTIERAVKDGDLPARKTARGGRDVWIVDAGATLLRGRRRQAGQ